MMRATLFAAAVAFGATSLKAATYDYWAALSPGGVTTTAAGTTEKVLVVIGNNGVAGSDSGPSYNVLLTVRTADGAAICSAGSATQPPIAKGQQLIALAFQLFYANAGGKDGIDAERRGTVPYLLQADISTQSPSEDANPSNGSQSKTFAFRAGARTACETLLSH